MDATDQLGKNTKKKNKIKGDVSATPVICTRNWNKSPPKHKKKKKNWGEIQEEKKNKTKKPLNKTKKNYVQ